LLSHGFEEMKFRIFAEILLFEVFLLICLWLAVDD